MAIENARRIVRERGVRLLDSIRPGWFRQIDLDHLKTEGVIEQLYGNFHNGIDSIGLAYAPMDYGFDDGIATKEELAQAWQEAIIEKRNVELPSIFD